MAQTGSDPSIRSNALWGRGGRRAGVAVVATICALVAPTAAAADDGHGRDGDTGAYLEPSLASAIVANPSGTFDVILEGDRKGGTPGFVKKALAGYTVTRKFRSIDGVEATLTGKQIQTLSHVDGVTAIVANDSVKPSSVALPYANSQKWAWVSHAPVDWNQTALSLSAPTIAVIDSGVDSSLAGIGTRLLGQVSLYSGTATNSPGDGYGHGTFVSSIAAGSADFAGVAPNANLLSLDVIADDGSATIGDVINACDWILANKATYNIKVANMSIQGSARASVFFDPLDQAVESLWLNGVTVVTAVGNYGQNGASTEVSYAPGNDPFVISVGASDIMDTVSTSDDVVAPWSAWGYTADAFTKPDLAAPGRYIIGSVPSGSGLAVERPDHVVGTNLMQLSGTSFSSPQVAGAAALILARHPDWTPDKVKGALEVSAQATPAATSRSLGVGELDIARARAVINPPNPNAGLDQYLGTNASGAPVFNASAWQTAAKSNAAWNNAAWSDAAWSDAAWGSAAWGSAAWGSAAWSDAAWSNAAWGSAATGSAAWSDAYVTDIGLPATAMTDAQITSVEQQLGIVDAIADPTA